MNVLDKLHAIEEAKIIYAILWRLAGVGIEFYEGPEIVGVRRDDSWKKYLKIETYHPSFEEAVNAEYLRIPHNKEKNERTGK